MRWQERVMGIEITKIWPTGTGPASEGGEADPVCHGPALAPPDPYDPANAEALNFAYCADGTTLPNLNHSNDDEVCCPGAIHTITMPEDVGVDSIDLTFGTGADDDLQPNPYVDPGSNDPSGGPGDYNGPGDFNGPGTGGSGGDGPGNEGDNGVIAFNGGAGGGGGEGNGGGSGGGDNGGSGPGGDNGGGGSGGDNGGGSDGGDNGGNGGGGGDSGGSGSGMPSDDGTDSNGGNNQIAVIGHAAGGGEGDGSAGSFNGDGEGTDVNLMGGLGGIDLGVGLHGTPGLHDPGEVRPDPEGSGTGGPTSHIANITLVGGGGFWDQAANASHGETTMLINAATSGAMAAAHEFSAASHGLDHVAAFDSRAEGHDSGLSFASFTPADVGSVNLHEHHSSTFETHMFI
jgi:hypothetical protein